MLRRHRTPSRRQRRRRRILGRRCVRLVRVLRAGKYLHHGLPGDDEPLPAQLGIPQRGQNPFRLLPQDLHPLSTRPYPLLQQPDHRRLFAPPRPRRHEVWAPPTATTTVVTTAASVPHSAAQERALRPATCRLRWSSGSGCIRGPREAGVVADQDALIVAVAADSVSGAEADRLVPCVGPAGDELVVHSRCA
jgi:hypothetical protein